MVDCPSPPERPANIADGSGETASTAHGAANNAYIKGLTDRLAVRRALRSARQARIDGATLAVAVATERLEAAKKSAYVHGTDPAAVLAASAATAAAYEAAREASAAAKETHAALLTSDLRVATFAALDADVKKHGTDKELEEALKAAQEACEVTDSARAASTAANAKLATSIAASDARSSLAALRADLATARAAEAIDVENLEKAEKALEACEAEAMRKEDDQGRLREQAVTEERLPVVEIPASSTSYFRMDSDDDDLPSTSYFRIDCEAIGSSTLRPRSSSAPPGRRQSPDNGNLRPHDAATHSHASNHQGSDAANDDAPEAATIWWWHSPGPSAASIATGVSMHLRNAPARRQGMMGAPATWPASRGGDTPHHSDPLLLEWTAEQFCSLPAPELAATSFDEAGPSHSPRRHLSTTRPRRDLDTSIDVQSRGDTPQSRANAMPLVRGRLATSEPIPSGLGDCSGKTGSRPPEPHALRVEVAGQVANHHVGSHRPELHASRVGVSGLVVTHGSRSTGVGAEPTDGGTLTVNEDMEATASPCNGIVYDRVETNMDTRICSATFGRDSSSSRQAPAHGDPSTDSGLAAMTRPASIGGSPPVIAALAGPLSEEDDVHVDGENDESCDLPSEEKGAADHVNYDDDNDNVHVNIHDAHDEHVHAHGDDPSMNESDKLDILFDELFNESKKRFVAIKDEPNMFKRQYMSEHYRKWFDNEKQKWRDLGCELEHPGDDEDHVYNDNVDNDFQHETLEQLLSWLHDRDDYVHVRSNVHIPDDHVHDHGDIVHDARDDDQDVNDRIDGVHDAHVYDHINGVHDAHDDDADGDNFVSIPDPIFHVDLKDGTDSILHMDLEAVDVNCNVHYAHGNGVHAHVHYAHGNGVHDHAHDVHDHVDDVHDAHDDYAHGNGVHDDVHDAHDDDAHGDDVHDDESVSIAKGRWACDGQWGPGKGQCAKGHALESLGKEQFDPLNAEVDSKSKRIAANKNRVTQIDKQIADLLDQRATVMKELHDDENQPTIDQEPLFNRTNTCSPSDGDSNQRMVHCTTAEPIVLGPATPPADDAPSIAGEPLSFSMLSLLATRGQLDAFIDIKMKIDEMIDGLKQQQGYETQHDDWSVDIAEEMFRKNLFINMGIELKQLVVSIEATTAIVAETQVQMNRASENRESDTADFPQTVVDQRGTQLFLQEALARMKQVYDLVESHEASLRPAALYDG
jgi:hypothetical protein